MPYRAIKIRGMNKYKVINSKTGKIHAKGTTKKKAQAQLRILRSKE